MEELPFYGVELSEDRQNEVQRLTSGAQECEATVTKGSSGTSFKAGSSTRPWCSRCDRVAVVCICSALRFPPLSLHRCKVWVLQHPLERKRKNSSMSVCKICFDPGSFEICTGRSFRDSPAHWLRTIRDGRSLIIFPGEGVQEFTSSLLDRALESAAKHVQEAARGGRSKGDDARIALIFIDGTWKEASEIFRNDLAKGVLSRDVCVTLPRSTDMRPLGYRERRFHVRNPPKKGFLSTGECVAWMVSLCESQPGLYETLMKPLDYMCHTWIRFARQDEGTQE